MSILPLSRIRYVAIEGVIGVGKTSLVHRLHADRGGARFLEAFEENPFLTGGFYSDIERYAFDTEMFFLLSRFRQQREIAAVLDEVDGPVLADYLFAKNHVFAEITLSGRDYAIWRRLYESLAPETRTPDLVVYLKAATPVLLDRIRTRNRPFERELSLDYLTRLNEAYDVFFEGYDDGRLLTIDVSRLDFVRSDADYAAVAAMVEHKVATIEEGQGELDFAREAAG
ncbi:MAG TPA: deoxynucleoside kinase [Gemmatimonadota bacterium]|nr:deoxynucleoside kinase [Gemmatimonadota bacterium]